MATAAAVQRVERSDTLTLCESARWWAIVGWKSKGSRFSSEEGAKTGSFSDDDGDADGGGEAARLLALANSAAPAGHRWAWACDGWAVIVDGNTDARGWQYATGWEKLSTPREGGRVYQRHTDFVRRRRIKRTILLVELGEGPTPPDVAAQLGTESDPREALQILEADVKINEAEEKAAAAQVHETVRMLFKTHVRSRDLSETPLDPTAWIRLANIHKKEMAALAQRRPAVGPEDAPLIADLAVAMRFANAAYGFAAPRMRSIGSNIAMHTCKVRGGVDVAEGVADEEHTRVLLELTGLEPHALLHTRWGGTVGHPACFVGVCEEKKWVVLSIRGTLNPADIWTDVDAAEAPFLGSVAHAGFAVSSHAIVRETMGCLLKAAADWAAQGYSLVVTGHSLGGCTAQTVALQLRHEGHKLADETERVFLSRARCMAFAGTAVATPELQQSAESRELTVCVIYGADMVPRFGVRSVITLLDELSDHGAYKILKRAVTGCVDEHANKFFPLWRGLPNGGKCAGQCGKKKSIRYCSDCFVCSDCNATTSCTKAREATGAPEPEAAIAKFALGGRVLWCVPPAKGEERATLRWCESEDFEKVMVSTKMVAHHCCPYYMGAMAAP